MDDTNVQIVLFHWSLVKTLNDLFIYHEVTNNFLNCFTGQAALMNLLEDLLELQQLLLLKNKETSSVLDETASDWVG